MTIQMLSFPCPHILANAIDRNRSLDTKHNQHVTDSHEKYKTEKKLGVFFFADAVVARRFLLFCTHSASGQNDERFCKVELSK